jgi:putative zinc finger/helix-turn-helix YgiT family protein
MKTNFTCIECADRSELITRLVDIRGERNGEEFIVTVPGYACPTCGFSTVDSTQSGQFTQALSDAYRSKHGLLTSAELKKLRQAREESQSDFATYLGVGLASVKRWECGQVQDKAMDELIRLKTDPEAASRNARYLNPPLLEVNVETQVYTPKVKMGYDMTCLEESEMWSNLEEPVAA